VQVQVQVQELESSVPLVLSAGLSFPPEYWVSVPE
jgi:hypothetical protein